MHNLHHYYSCLQKVELNKETKARSKKIKNITESQEYSRADTTENTNNMKAISNIKYERTENHSLFLNTESKFYILFYICTLFKIFYYNYFDKTIKCFILLL